MIILFLFVVIYKIVYIRGENNLFQELKTFIAVVELKNFTKAASYLNLSQPSVSTHIKNLENYFNTTLINRSVKQKNIVITENGYKLYERAKEILDLLNTTYNDLHNMSDTIRGTLKIGASRTIGECILPKFLTYFIKKYPNVDVEVIIENTSSICNYVKNYSIDIGLIEGPSTVSNIDQTYFFEDSMVLAYPVKQNLVGKNALQNRNWLIREEGSGTREYLNLFLTLNKITPKNIIVLGSNYAIKEAVKEGLGITIISDLVIKSEMNSSEIKTYPLDKAFNRHFSYIKPININESKICSLFLEELSSYFKNNP